MLISVLQYMAMSYMATDQKGVSLWPLNREYTFCFQLQHEYSQRLNEQLSGIEESQNRTQQPAQSQRRRQGHLNQIVKPPGQLTIDQCKPFMVKRDVNTSNSKGPGDEACLGMDTPQVSKKMSKDCNVGQPYVRAICDNHICH